jgi:hypothetical protein
VKERKDSESEVEEVVSTRKPTLESSLRMSRAREIGLLIPKREFSLSSLFNKPNP